MIAAMRVVCAVMCDWMTVTNACIIHTTSPLRLRVRQKSMEYEHWGQRLNKKLSYCWETVRRESMPRIAEMDVEMTT